MGGSATNDGGAGCARALGVKFFDEKNGELPDGGIHLSRLHRIEIKNEELRMKNIEIIGLSDVTNILCGPEGAAFTFAAQKGATPEQVRMLDEALKHYASIIENDLHRDVSAFPEAGLPAASAPGCLHSAMPKFFPASILCSMHFGSTIYFSNAIALSPPKERWTHRLCTVRGSKASCGAQRNSTSRSTLSPEKILGEKATLQGKLGLATLHQISPDDVSIEEAMRNAEAFLLKGIRDYFSTKTTKE